MADGERGGPRRTRNGWSHLVSLLPSGGTELTGVEGIVTSPQQLTSPPGPFHLSSFNSRG